jgi:cytochrome c-type biogenesis protein CcmH/NrfG
LFQQVLEAIPTDSDALTGLKQVESLLHSKSKEKQEKQPPLDPQEKEKEKEEEAASTQAMAKALNQATADIAHYEALVKENPDNAEYIYQLGRSYSQAKDWDKSIATLNHALELQTNNPDIRLALAYAHLQRYTSESNLLKSKHLFQQVLQAVPNYIDAQGGLKQVEDILNPSPEETSQKKKTFHFLERKIKGNNPSVLTNSNSQELSNVSYYESLTQENPDQPHYFYLLGRAYSQANQWDMSIKAFNRALELQPNNQDTRLALAYALLFEYRSKRDLMESEKSFHQVLEAIPTYQDAKEGLQHVENLLHPLKEENEKQLKDIEKKNSPLCLEEK